MKKPKYLKLWRRSKKDPTLRYAARVNGHTIELTKAFGTIEFDEEFEAAKAKLLSCVPPKAEIAEANKPRRNSVAHLYEEYIKLPEFTKLNSKTQYDRKFYLTASMRQRASNDPNSSGYKFLFGDYTVAHLKPSHFYGLRDRKAQERNRKGKPKNATANLWLTAWREVFKAALPRRLCGLDPDKPNANPVAAVPYLPYHSDGFEPWTEEDEANYDARWPIGTRQRLAKELFRRMYGRRGDVHRLGPQHDIGGFLKFVSQKNEHREGRKPNVLVIPIDPELRRAIDATNCIGTHNYILNDKGNPFKNPCTFGQWFARACEEAGVSKRAHGLRKTGISEAHNADAGIAGLQALGGWTTLEQPATYARAYNQPDAAARAMEKVLKYRDRKNPREL
jgi:hypothetical protein